MLKLNVFKYFKPFSHLNYAVVDNFKSFELIPNYIQCYKLSTNI